MAIYNDPSSPANMPPDERVGEVAALLAKGLLRLRKSSAISITSPLPPEIEPLAEFGEGDLDESPETRLHGQGADTPHKRQKGISA